MDIRDYLRMLRRGWPTVVGITAVFIILTIAYLALTPKIYESSTVLYVSANAPTTIVDLQQGAQFSEDAVATYAAIIGSATVLGTVADQLSPQRSVEELTLMVGATARTGTTLIDVVVSGDNPEDVAVIANSTAAEATRIIPALENPVGTPLVRIQQIRPAVEPTEPVSPNVTRMLALGLVVGLFVSVGATIAIQALDTRIRRVLDLRVLTHIPVLGTLPSVRRAQRGGIVVRDDPAGTSGEAFRALRTNVRYLESQDRRSLVIASVADNTDNAQVPANLAWMLAEAGDRVLLIDADLRRSPAGAAFGLVDGPGLADVILGEAELAHTVRDTDHPRLQILLAGTHSPSPSELLSSPVMKETLRRVEKTFDYVILHVPPILSYTDAAVVSSAAGGTLVTVAAGRTRAQELTSAVTVLGNVRVEPVGLVLTRAAKSVMERGRNVTRPTKKWGAGAALHRAQWDWRRDRSKQI